MELKKDKTLSIKKKNTMTNLSQVLVSYFVRMQGPLCVLTLCHARHFRENIYSVTKDVLY
jgi:hypothetical protein